MTPKCQKAVNWVNKCQCHTVSHESEPDFAFFNHGIMVGSTCTARAVSPQSILGIALGTDQSTRRKAFPVLSEF